MTEIKFRMPGGMIEMVQQLCTACRQLAGGEYTLVLMPTHKWLKTEKMLNRLRLRSLEQNSTMWMWLTVIGNHFGYSKDEMKKILQDELMPEHTVWFRGKAHDCRGTRDMTKAQMTYFMDLIQQFAANEGIVLPLPKDKKEYDQMVEETIHRI